MSRLPDEDGFAQEAPPSDKRGRESEQSGEQGPGAAQGETERKDSE